MCQTTHRFSKRLVLIRSGVKSSFKTGSHGSHTMIIHPCGEPRRSRTNKSSDSLLSDAHCTLSGFIPKRSIAEFMRRYRRPHIGGASEALKRGSCCPTLTALRQLSFRHADPQEPAATAGAPARLFSPLLPLRFLSTLTNTDTGIHRATVEITVWRVYT